MNRVLCVFSALCIFLSAESASAFQDPVPYRPDFDWTPYGDPPAGSDPKLSAYTKWHHEPSATGNSVDPKAGGGFQATRTFNVETQLLPAESWVRPAAKNAALLRHEQYHMDIAYFWGRWLENCLNAAKGCGATKQAAINDLQAKQDKCIQNANGLCSVVQWLYDLTTDHGKNEDAQELWCALCGFLVPAPPAKKEEAEQDRECAFVPPPNDESPGQLQVNEALGEFRFSVGGVFLDDAGLTGTTLTLPPLDHVGFHMIESRPLFRLDEELWLEWSSSAGLLLRSHVRAMVGSGNGDSLRAWMDGIEITQLGLDSSSFLAGFADRVFSGQGTAVLELKLPVPFAELTDGGTGTANFQAIVSVGVSDPDDPCDTNVDQVFDANDIAPFFGILAGTYPRMSLVAGDLNGDGEVDELDVPLFLEKLGDLDDQ